MSNDIIDVAVIKAQTQMRLEEINRERETLLKLLEVMDEMEANPPKSEPKSAAKPKTAKSKATPKSEPEPEPKSRPRRTAKPESDDEELATKRQRYWLERMEWDGDIDNVTKREASTILEELFAENDEHREQAKKEVARSRPRRTANSNGHKSERAAKAARKPVATKGKTNGPVVEDDDDDDDDDTTLADAIRVLTEEGMSPKAIEAETGANISYVYLIRRQMKAAK